MVAKLLSSAVLLFVLGVASSFSVVHQNTIVARQQQQQQQQQPYGSFLEAGRCCGRRRSVTFVALSSSSRLEGNQRRPSAQETEVMDEMIDKLLDAKPYELPSAVKRAFQVIRSPQFFLRIAQRSDQASSEEERQRFQILASNLVTTVEAVVETTTEQLEERAQAVEAVVKAAAEPDSGEFLVPLTADRIAAMQCTITNLDESILDEGFLATLDAWIVKSHQDGMDGMVGILQKVLQMYAGLAISRALKNQKQQEQQEEIRGGDAVAAQDGKVELEQLLKSDASDWDSLLKSQPKDVIAKMRKIVQRTMETVVLSLETGSMAQQVQAEYLKELLSRVETAEKQA
ncbi:hypothetical protein ACA910_012871 [Epithemia clementina (nom. ined.)]